jgi:hypothetical protein
MKGSSLGPAMSARGASFRWSKDRLSLGPPGRTHLVAQDDRLQPA